MIENLVDSLLHSLDEDGSYLLSTKEIYLVLALVGELEYLSRIKV